MSTILIVEDNFELLEGLEALLTLHDYKVVTCHDGEEALKILEEQTINLAIADVGLPKLNGYQLFTHMVNHDQWQFIPVVLVSGRSLDSDISYAKSLGVDDYITKPIDFQLLLAVVKGKLKRFQQFQTKFSSSITTSRYEVGSFLFDGPWQKLYVGETNIPLGEKEYRLLYHLAKNIGQPINLIMLAEVVHGLNNADRVEASNLIRPIIRTVRRKFKDHNISDPILTVRNIGYSFLAQLSDTQ